MFCCMAKSFNNPFNHRPSLIAFVNAMYSASVVDKATIGCNDAFQLIRLGPYTNI